MLSDPVREPTAEPCIVKDRASKECIMAATVYRSSRPHQWIVPRPHTDAHQRMRTYGPIQPMDEPSWLDRLFFGRG